MKQALDRVKQVLVNSNLAPHLAFVCCKDNWLSASDGRLHASAPTDCDLDFLVKGQELDRALTFHPDMAMSVTDKGLLLKHGRSRINLKILPESNFFHVDPPRSWRAVPAGYFDALRRAAAYTSENATQAWALGVMNLHGRLVSTNNVALAVVDFPDAPIHGIVPVWLIDFVNKLGEEPAGVWDTPTAIFLEFADGSWVRSMRIEGDAPAMLEDFVQRLYERSGDIWEIPKDWRDVYRRTLEFSKRDIHVTPTCISAIGETSELSTEVPTPVEADTLWDHKFLGPVLTEATHWDIASAGSVDAPSHSFWYGNGIRGLIASKKRISV